MISFTSSSPVDPGQFLPPWQIRDAVAPRSSDGEEANPDARRPQLVTYLVACLGSAMMASTAARQEA